MLCLLIMLVHITISGGRIAVTLTALNLERSTLEVGILIAVFALLPALFSVKAGQLIDKIGPWKPMRASAIAVIIGALLPCIWQELASLMDHRALLVAYDAARFRESQKALKASAKQLGQKPKVAKPGASVGKAEANDEATKALRQQLKKTGRVEDAAKLFERFG